MTILTVLQNRVATTEQFGLALFLLSTVVIGASNKLGTSFPVTRLRLGKGVQTSESEYTDLLRRLYQPVQTTSRHLASKNLDADQIFAMRKNFFQNMYRQLKLNRCKVIHVTGTKGKGSTCEYISSALISAGYTVGTFTSPHLHTARERVKYGRELISIDDFVELGRQAITRLEDQPWAVFFDYFFTLALLYFSRKQPEYLVIEVGIGGRYDSTNIFENPVAGVITAISLDHQAILGSSIGEIAWQKAGIMKPDMTLFTTIDQHPDAARVLREQAQLNRCRLVEVASNKSTLDSIGVSYGHATQLQNICVAQAVASHLQISSKGMRDFFWPCRMESFVYKGQEIVLDGCHNGESVSVFLSSLREKYPGHTRIVLFGAGIEKSIDDMIHAVFEGAERVILVQSKHFKSYSEQQLAQLVPVHLAHKLVYLPPIESSLKDSSKCIGGTVAHRVLHSIRTISRQPPQPTVLAVCGSLFVASDAREALNRLAPELFSCRDWVHEADPPV